MNEEEAEDEGNRREDYSMIFNVNSFHCNIEFSSACHNGRKNSLHEKILLLHIPHIYNITHALHVILLIKKSIIFIVVSLGQFRSPKKDVSLVDVEGSIDEC